MCAVSRCRFGLAAALVAGLAGCAHATSPGGPQAARTVAFAVSSDPATLDPLFAHADAGAVEQQLAHLVFEPFFDLDAAGKPVPELL